MKKTNHLLHWDNGLRVSSNEYLSPDNILDKKEERDMKLSIVNGERREPEKGLIGSCLGCGQPMIPKCGSIKIWHWAHKSSCECDHWWENETEWHRSWKNNFPKENQEIRHKDDATGEWHIADVKTKHGHVLEFQHSFLKP